MASEIILMYNQYWAFTDTDNTHKALMTEYKIRVYVNNRSTPANVYTLRDKYKLLDKLLELMVEFNATLFWQSMIPGIITEGIKIRMDVATFAGYIRIGAIRVE